MYKNLAQNGKRLVYQSQPLSGPANMGTLVRSKNQRLRMFSQATDEGSEQVGTGVELKGQNFGPLKDIEAIKELLPHRYPFLLVDRLVEMESGKYGVGYKNVTANDNFFTGHFPERMIMPGVLQVEAMAQLAGIIMLEEADEEARNNFFFGGIENCRFKRIVVPGDVLMMRVNIVKFNKRFGLCKAKGTAYVGEEVACEADLTLVMAKQK